jgi:transaldolase
MKFFVDTADLGEIQELAASGLLDGVTTNPSLVAKSGAANFIDLIAAICKIVPGPVSAEVAATDFATMVKEGEKLAKIASNVTVKLPLTYDGIRACKVFSSQGIKTNVTLCFSANQAILAAKAGATYVSPFVGRLDDISVDGLIADIVQIYRNYPEFTTQVLAASVRHPVHLMECAKIGADVATLPPSVLKQLFNHPLTDKGLAGFMADWEKSGQKIL